MKSPVFFMDLRATHKESFSEKISRLMDTAGLSSVLKERDLVAVKLHFGEAGNTAFIRPVYLRKIVKTIHKSGGVPFLTDANTLYAGTRGDSPHHLQTAVQNGFAYSVVEAPIIIADGLRGKNESGVEIKGNRFQRVYIGSEIIESDALVSVAHFKGHDLSGFGGTIKNLGMGCASRKGKLAQHSGLSPKIKRKQCIACEDCIGHCSQSAIFLKDEKAVIDSERCIGCGECILICPQGAIQIQWSVSVPIFMENLVEYTMGVLKNKSGKTLFLNFITDVSPGCDCWGYNDAPLVRNIGVVTSKDPVAIDQASVDLVNAEPALPNTCLTTNTGPGEDKFGGVYPEVNWEYQLEYAEQMGLGSRKYSLEEI